MSSPPTPSSNPGHRTALIGAAFLMATSAIGPGFLTQTSLFTAQLGASLGFAILLSVLLDLGAQLNIWRIVTLSGRRAQDLANAVFPGMGTLLSVLIAFGGLVFNIGNIAGCGLGAEALTGLSPETGACISCLLALGLFWFREAGKLMDRFAGLLGMLMIAVVLYIAFRSQPPVGEALFRTLWPERIEWLSVVTLVGGTVGGYISFAGAHRLLDAGIQGRDRLPQVNRSAVSGILLTSVMRFLLFLAVLGVVTSGATIDEGNPAASVFRSAAGIPGYRFFGVVIWCAAITSVVGASYTSVSFWKTLVPVIARREKIVISLFIITSTLIFVGVGRPVALLVMAGAVNGLILPLALSVLLLAARRSSLLGGYRYPLLLQAMGWAVTVLMSWMGFVGLQQGIRSLWEK
ncbi:MAG: hypothetical protein RJA57_1354 [Bacteroidota bacterium]|jgi:Mn2+/Fe2+ NRAMP family transporter